MKERSLLQESNNKLVRDIQMLQSEQEHLDKTNDKLNKENKNKMNLISQLEKVLFYFGMAAMPVPLLFGSGCSVRFFVRLLGIVLPSI